MAFQRKKHRNVTSGWICGGGIGVREPPSKAENLLVVHEVEVGCIVSSVGERCGVG